MIELILIFSFLALLFVAMGAYQNYQVNKLIGRTPYERDQTKERIDRLRFYREEYGVNIDPDCRGFRWMYDTKEGKESFWKETRNGDLNRKFKEWRKRI